VKVAHIVNTVYASRTYILWNGSVPEFWLVDCGDVAPLVDLLTSMGGGSFKIKGVLLTHAHYDHIYGLPKLTELFPDVRVYTNEYGKVMLADERKNMSRYHEDPINYESDNILVCEDGDKVELFEDVTAVAYFTPGHNPSCITYEVGAYLFTGDSYIPGVKVVTNLPGGDKTLATLSLEKILRLAKGTILYPGHVVGYNEFV